MQELQRKLMDYLRPNVTRVEMGRKASLLDQGDVSQKLFFVEAGCLRLYRVDEEGEDTTLFFFMEGEMVASFESFLQSEPSEFGIEAVAPTIVQCIEKTSVFELLDKNLEFRTLTFDMLISRLASYQRLFLNTIRNSPQKRYEDLVKSNPKLFETVPQHYIASYLGVTPVSLSRIRKKV
ncbi:MULTISPECIES: Crp/Fnr family transcriptional regulator [unclassified Pseudovibrio]|uniref:Crp/Fnr family transcriptional regulator n=1 Tax=unclassified Pseudovibrio TaxID=2627060 RepID=UPI0007AEDD46|nr:MULTISPECIES: Crp/Fnr family transcriptional regulator [unclassified Pseudovibrio]KZL17350.1 Cyclic nucleotide-binding domain protein [Pseudovibrio sp. WM33]KZL25780.1 Cyclic nucleotide-binding domain protein [Pseudovibrio sp. Ad37]